MYAAYFGLSESPFSISPDPRYLYMSKRHKEAMAHLLYGIAEGGGFALLTGEVGTGKTTLCRCLLTQMPNHVDVALILNPQISETELLATLCDELKVAYPPEASPKKQLDLLNDHLLQAYARGRGTVMIIDEAQLLSRDVLEQIRILTNLETSKHKLLQIILIGQPELNATLSKPDLRQLSQRITARYHLEPLSYQDTAEYIKYRVAVAGCQRPLFTRGGIRRVYRHSHGIPRLVNLICDRSLLGAYARNKQQVTALVADHAAREVLSGSRRRRWSRFTWLIPVAAAASVLLIVPAMTGHLVNFLPAIDPANTASSVAVDENAEPGETVLVDRQPDLASSANDEDSQAAPVEPATATTTEPAADSQAGDGPMPVETASYYRPTETIALVKRPVGSAPSGAPQTPVGSVSGSFLEQQLVTRYLPIGPVNVGKVNTAPTDTPLRVVLREARDLTTAGTAFRALVGTWGLVVDVNTIETGCRRLLSSGLRCLKRLGNWNSLRGYNRAAILNLWYDGTEHQVLIRALNEDDVTLDIGGAAYTFPITEVDSLWFGKYLLLWRPPPMVSLPIGVSSKGADVLWLRQALKRALDQPATVEISNPGFDFGLRQQVIEFQRSHAIQEDGIVGVETLIRLNTSLDSRYVPLLVKARAG